VPGAVETHGIELPGVQAAWPASWELAQPNAPGFGGVGLVESQRVDQLFPRALPSLSPSSRARVHEARPLREPAHGTTVQFVVRGVDHLEVLLDGREGVTARPASDRCRRAAPGGIWGVIEIPHAMTFAEREQPLSIPGGDEVDRVFGRVLEAGTRLDERVEVPGIDELRPALVGLGPPRAATRGAARGSATIQTIWPGLNIRPDFDDQFSRSD